MRRIGVISDTHGLLRPEAITALAGVEHILHAGDVGSPEILARLRELAPVTAVRGNNDGSPWAKELVETALIEIAGRRICIIHDLKELELDPVAAGFAVVVAGHSHRPSVTMNGPVLYLNPGSAGPRRFRLPVTVALLELGDAGVVAQIRELI